MFPHPVRATHVSPTQKALLFCGISSSLLYAGMNVFVPMRWEGYSSVTQTVSELSAIGAPTRALWVPLGFIYALLLTAFGWGVWRSAASNRSLRIVGCLLIVQGIVSMTWPPMHQREVLAAGGGTLTDTLHIIWTLAHLILMTLELGFGAVALGRRFRLYSIATAIALVLFGVLTSFEAPGIETNSPTPWIGVWERINIGVSMLWTAVLAVVLLRRDTAAEIRGDVLAASVAS